MGPLTLPEDEFNHLPHEEQVAAVLQYGTELNWWLNMYKRRMQGDGWVKKEEKEEDCSLILDLFP